MERSEYGFLFSRITLRSIRATSFFTFPEGKAPPFLKGRLGGITCVSLIGRIHRWF